MFAYKKKYIISRVSAGNYHINNYLHPALYVLTNNKLSKYFRLGHEATHSYVQKNTVKNTRIVMLVNLKKHSLLHRFVFPANKSSR